MNNYVNPVKSLEKLQAESRVKNQAEADLLCKNICLCLGWCAVLLFICYLIIMIIIVGIHRFDTGCEDKKCEELLIIEEYYSSGSEEN